MCGFFASNDPLISKTHKTILDKHLKFRGPDYQSDLIDFKNWKIYHARLSIIGLSNKYNQPFVNKNDGSILLFNGEILNYKQLALEKLKKKEYSDTKTLSSLLELKDFKFEWLDGFFSFVKISKNGKLINCARDFFGVKPLFYYKKNKYISICSEPGVLQQIYKLKLSKNSIKEYKLFRYPIFSQSYYQGIQSLEPGTCLVTKKKFFDLSKFQIKNLKNKNIKIRDSLKKSIESRHVSDVKTGILLSGGIDSNLVRIYSKHINEYYTGGFKNDYDYSYLKKSKINNIHFTKMTSKKIKNRLIKLIKMRNEPISVPNEVALSLIAEDAKKRGVKVLLSGEGADEFFCGYDRIFREFKNKKKFNLKKFIEMYCYSDLRNEKTIFVKLKNIFKKLKLSPFEKVRFFFIKYHLPVLLRRLDFSLMSSGIEGREPFLSLELLKTAFSLDAGKLLNKNIGKLPLRNILSKKMGKEFAFLKKVGFPIDIKKIFKSKEYVNDNNYDIWFKINLKILKNANKTL